MKHAFLGSLLAALVLAGCSGDSGRSAAASAARLPAQAGSAQTHGVAAAAAPTAARNRPGFATLPDRGELADYRASRPTSAKTVRRGAYTWHRIDISEAHALNAIAGRPLRITTPSGELLDFRYERHVEHPSGDWTWIGQLEGGAPSDQAIVTFGAQAVFGSLAQRDDAPLRLAMREGVSWLVETDRSLLAKVDNAATRPTKPDYLLPPKPASWAPAANAPATNRGPASVGNAPGTSPATAGIAGSTVDVLLGYTNGFAASVGGQSAAVTRLNNLIDTANVALQNSQLTMRFRLVHAMQVNYVDNTDNQTALEEMTGFVAPSTETTPKPAFNALRAAREQYGADLVSLVRKFTDPENNGCGIAWLVGAGQTPITQEYEFFGYSVISDGQDGSFYCREETLAHELAHNMGSAHDRETAEGDDGTLDPNEYGRYPYSFGQKTTPGSGDFYTVMAYGDSGQVPYRIYSNPRTTFCGGRPCGVENQIDNARSLSQTMPIVATFRSSASFARARNDIDGDGRSDLLWIRSGSSASFGYWIMQASNSVRSWATGVSASYRVAATGDFDGDGLLDLVWTSAARDLWLWTGNGTSFTSRPLGSHAAGWTLLGAGDVDGNGRSDLLWRNTSSGQFGYWIMDGSRLVRSLVISASPDYEVAASGDFNADGFLDLVWTSSARDLYLWFGNGNFFTSVRIQDYGEGWSLLETGDINGDGKSDLLWQHQPSNDLTYWLMDGSYVVRGWVFPVASGYRVGATGDLNGDGMVDLVWTSSARDLWLWTSNGSTFNSSRMANYPAGWYLTGTSILR